MNSEYSPIDSLSSFLTPAQLVKFLQKAVPDLKLRQSSLQLALEKQQWEVAAKQAHDLKSSISFFKDDSLAAKLESIETGNDDVIKSPGFIESLMLQCQQLIDSLEDYLSQNQS